MGMDHGAHIRAALLVMERAGIRAFCARTGNQWTATATDSTGHTWRVTADTGSPVISPSNRVEYDEPPPGKRLHRGCPR